MNDFDPFERRLAVALRSDADRFVTQFDPVSIARAATHGDRTRQRRAMRLPWRFPAMNTLTSIAAAIVIGVLAVEGSLSLMQRGQPAVVGGPSPIPSATGASPSASPVPSASPQPTTPVALRGRDWEWRDVWFEDPLGQMPSLTGVIFTGAGFTAWGPDSVGGSAMVTSTSDLASWGQTGDPQQFAGVRIIGLAWAPAGLVALGADQKGGVHAWISTDGTTWKAGPAPSGIDGTVEAVISSSGGLYYAAGTAKGGCDVAIWVSADGLTWQPSGPLSGARGTCSSGGASDGPKITRLRDGGAGMVAYGTIPGIGGAFWTAADDVHWTFHAQPSLGGHLSGLAATSSGYIAVGTIGTGGGIVWRSSDGITWSQGPDQASFAGVALADVLALDDGSLVVVGSDAEHAFLAWTSSDGQRWSQAPAALDSTSSPLGRPDHPIGWVLASDGHAAAGHPSELLIAVGGGTSRAMVSPPTTSGLRAGSLTISLSGLVDLPTETVVGACADRGDGNGGADVRVILADLAQPNPADVSLTVTPNGGVAGFSLSTDNLMVAFGQGAPDAASTLALVPGSTLQSGSATLQGLVDTLAPGDSRLNATVAWSCAW